MSEYNDNIVFLKFAEAVQPVFKEVRGKKYVYHGEFNEYPVYLLSLFNSSPKHGAIIKGKAQYIAGTGIVGLHPMVKKANRYGESLHNVLRKCALDYEIYDGYYLEVITNNIGQVTEVYHVDYHKVRSNAENTLFFIKDNWKTGDRGEMSERFAWRPDANLPTSLLFVKGYRPGVDVYTLPMYLSNLNYVEADIEVSKHVLTNAKSGFMPSKLINLNNGEPPEDKKKEIERRFEKKYTGADGKTFILSFNAAPDRAPTILDLGASDLTKEDFGRIDELIGQNIFTGHQITSPMLFGIKTPGQLGGRSELLDAYEIFTNTYVQPRQKMHEDIFSRLIGVQLEVVPLEPISIQLSEAAIAAVAPKVWLLQKAGIPENEFPQVYDRARKEDAGPPPMPLPLPMGGPGGVPPNAAPPVPPMAPAAPVRMADEKKPSRELFSKYGRAKDEYNVIKSRGVKFSKDEEAAAYEDALLWSGAFATFATLRKDIAKLLKKDGTLQPGKVADILNIDIAEVRRVIAAMIAAKELNVREVRTQDGTKQKVYDVTAKGVEATDPKKPWSAEVGVRYSYEVKPEYRKPNEEDPTGQIIPTSREFCREMIAADRFYTRRDIEDMSMEMGYSVWDQKGGWMGITGTDKKSPECRHHWVANLVAKKTVEA